MPAVSEMTEIPGNRNLATDEIKARADAFYWPFQNAVASVLDQRKARGQPSILLAMHSFTPVFKGFVRPGHAGLLFRKSERLGRQLVQRLKRLHAWWRKTSPIRSAMTATTQYRSMAKPAGSRPFFLKSGRT